MSLNRAILKKYAFLKSEMEKPYAERKKRQIERIHRQLLLAQAKVPFYQDLFRKLAFDPDKILKDLRYFEDLPFIDKDTVRDQMERFIHVDHPVSSLIQRETNGSTGPTIPVYYDMEALDWSSAVNLYTNSSLGKPPSQSETYIVPTELVAGRFSHKLAEWVKCAVLNRRNVHYRNLGDDDLDRILRVLRHSKPNLILAAPSTFSALAQYVKRNPRRAVQLNTLISTGEILDEVKKQEIETYLRCRIFNRLGNAEVGIFAHDTLHENLKVIDFIAYVETVKDGNSSEIVITNLRNDVMPLIRYRTGDLGELVRTPHGECLRNVYGRVHEILYLNGESVHTNLIKETLFKIGNVDDFQVHKCPDRGYLLKLVVGEKFRDRVKSTVRRIWGDVFEIQFVSIEQLTMVGTRQKFQYFIDNTMNQKREERNP